MAMAIISTKNSVIPWIIFLILGFFIALARLLAVDDLRSHSSSTILAWLSIQHNPISTPIIGNFSSVKNADERDGALMGNFDQDVNKTGNVEEPTTNNADSPSQMVEESMNDKDLSQLETDEEFDDKDMTIEEDIPDVVSEPSNDESVFQDSKEDSKSSTTVPQKCNLFEGSWVHDESHSTYEPFICPFRDRAFQCIENGRKNTGYLKWRWQPSACNLPRFDATDMLKRLRRKRLVFVGDSIGRNQWESLVCMLYQGVKNRSNVFEARSQKISKTRPSYSIRFTDYNTQVDYHRSHFLVLESTKRPPGATNKKRRCSLTLDKLDKTSSRWRNADILIFNSGHWWLHRKIRTGRCYFIERGNYSTSMDAFTAYEKSMRTWASWVDHNVASKHVFFRGYAPSHFSGGDWDTGGTCEMHTQPLQEEKVLGEYPQHARIVERVLSSMKTRVTYLNVTRLTQFRKDGHVAGWGKPRGSGSQDCSHWCLPGVPDTWNQLLYSYLSG